MNISPELLSAELSQHSASRIPRRASFDPTFPPAARPFPPEHRHPYTSITTLEELLSQVSPMAVSNAQHFFVPRGSACGERVSHLVVIER